MKFSRGVYFPETSHLRSLMKIKSSRNGDVGKSCPSLEFLNAIRENFQIYSMKKLIDVMKSKLDTINPINALCLIQNFGTDFLSLSLIRNLTPIIFNNIKYKANRSALSRICVQAFFLKSFIHVIQQH